ncbi:MAG: hypothetical protein ACM3O3_12615 [Syntrophothermus sp.]
MKKKLSLILAVIFVLTVSISAFAGVQTWVAKQPTYTIKINGNKVKNDEALVVNGTSYIKLTSLAKYGVTSTWDATNRIANFTIPQVEDDTDIQPPANEEISLLNNEKASVRFYNGNVFLGNGVWIDDDLILTTKTIWSNATRVKEYDDNYLTMDTNPVVKEAERLVILKSKTKTKYKVTLAEKTPEIGDVSVLIGSINQTPNIINVGNVHDYEDFNLYDSNNKEYMRTTNNVDASSYGSGMFNDNGELTGLVFWKGQNYCICVKLADLKNIID